MWFVLASSIVQTQAGAPKPQVWMMPPDEYVVESWVGAPSRSVPETGGWTFTHSVRDFCKRFLKPKR